MGEKKKGFDLASVLGGVSNLDTGAANRIQLEYIDIDLIDPDPNNRKELKNIEALAQNLLLVGLQQPLGIRRNPDDPGRYILITGHRRRLAIKSLVDAGEEAWRSVPCLVGDDGDTPAMIRLKLLSGNIVTQELTSAEMAQATKDFEDCIYQLKEEGHEFHGKVRDYVADAFNVSASRLARLKKIRDNLGEEFKPLYEMDQIGESTAYVLSRFPKDFQSRLARALKAREGGVGGYALPVVEKLEQILKEYEEGRRWEPCMTCPDGKECRRGDTFLRHDCDEYSWGHRCGGETCCLECRQAATSSYPCESMCSKAKARRTENNAKAREAEKRQTLKAAQRVRRATKATAQRLLTLIDAAGLKDEDILPFCTYDKPTIAQVRRWADGQFEENECLYSAKFDLKYITGECIIATANLLGCSTDFLLGLTDKPGEKAVPAQVKPQWLTGDPPEPCWAYVQMDIGGNRGQNLIRGSYYWSGFHWLFNPGGDDIHFPVVGWWPIPKRDDEDDADG